MTNAVLRALNSAHFLAAAIQGDTALTNDIADIITRLQKLSPDLARLVEHAVALDPEVYGRVQPLFADIPQPDDVQVYVVVKQLVETSNLYAEDVDISGHYEILVPGFLSDELQAACALDVFHGTVAIKMLDDFSIVVGKYLDAPENYNNGDLEKLGDFVGITERTSF